MAGMDADMMANMPAGAMVGMDADMMANMPAGAMVGMDADMMAALDPTTAASLSTEQTASLSATAAAALTGGGSGSGGASGGAGGAVPGGAGGSPAPPGGTTPPTGVVYIVTVPTVAFLQFNLATGGGAQTKAPAITISKTRSPLVLNSTSFSNYPLELSTTADGPRIWNSGTAYTTGVNKNIPYTKLTWDLTTVTPGTYYYYNPNTPNMGGQITIN
jgi:hypothetical protein